MSKTKKTVVDLVATMESDQGNPNGVVVEKTTKNTTTKIAKMKAAVVEDEARREVDEQERVDAFLAAPQWDGVEVRLSLATYSLLLDLRKSLGLPSLLVVSSECAMDAEAFLSEAARIVFFGLSSVADLRAFGRNFEALQAAVDRWMDQHVTFSNRMQLIELAFHVITLCYQNRHESTGDSDGVNVGK